MMRYMNNYGDVFMPYSLINAQTTGIQEAIAYSQLSVFSMVVE